jgi:thioredoxin reductase (NADPH)
MFPTLSAADIRHMQRFGHVACFRDGEMIFQAGKTSFGLMLVLKGGIEVDRYDGWATPPM